MGRTLDHMGRTMHHMMLVQHTIKGALGCCEEDDFMLTNALHAYHKITN